MARSDAVWGIDIGNSSLKALRCRLDDEPHRLIADAFDYIEYPKILTQPGAEPAELIADALKQFLSRNSVRGDRVAISVSGQNGLARFIKLPPVEAKKIPDIVRYEARQQIPFDLDDVVWDYQRMGGGSVEEGFALETEIGLFAMKRDQVFRALEPFRNVGIEVDVVQLTPLALYNFLAFDQLYDLPPVDEYDPENPPPSIVILSMGTDATDLVVTNGYRVWQRSIPLGGNHFTKALTKELKLTFAKAEHLKRNATAAQDPKAVFQAMRPVFNDLLTEIQRSIGYFTSIDRHAKIGQVVTLGNAMKLPGLRRYLSQSLGFDVVRLEAFRGLAGPEVVVAPAFKENLLCFGVSYGLALQGLGKSALGTNLLPKEIVKDRLIREKKPWAVAAAAVLLLGCTISFVSYSLALGTVDEKLFGSAEQETGQVIKMAQGFQAAATEAEKKFTATDKIGQNLVGNIEGRILWLELLRTINSCLPSDPEDKRPEEIMLRNELRISNIECQRMDKLEQWFAVMKQQNWYQPPPAEEKAPPAAGPAAAAAGVGQPVPGMPTAPVAPGMAPGLAAGQPSPGVPGPAGTGTPTGTPTGEEAPAEGPQGPGWVVQLTGHHYHNQQQAGRNLGAEFVRNTLIKNLHTMKVVLPKGDEPNKVEAVSIKDLGISYPVLVNPGPVVEHTERDPRIEVAEGAGERRGPMAAGGAEPENAVKLRRFDFVVQFVWQPTPPSVRHQRAEEEEKAKDQAGVPPQP